MVEMDLGPTCRISTIRGDGGMPARSAMQTGRQSFARCSRSDIASVPEWTKVHLLLPGFRRHNCGPRQHGAVSALAWSARGI